MGLRGPKTRPFQERFWEKVDKTGSCWVWKACRHDAGYGYFSVSRSRARTTHRISWELAFGPIPDGMDVLHKCNVKVCVNPDHLYLGTDLENSRDAVADGLILFGENSHRAKLTAEQVRTIRTRYNTENISQEALGREFGISQTAVGKITRRSRWKHVQ